MCCKCCSGRLLWLSAKRIFEDGCPALKEQARQTFLIYGPGIEDNKASNMEDQGSVDDDFWMHSDGDDADELEL